MITLNLFESNWWDSFLEINVLKSVNKLYFCQNNKKVGKFSFLIFNLFTFQIQENIQAKFT
jgi:hypothetical protein